ncbi:MAG: nucleotidyltransferase family protein [Magnetococcales bacterium]|nr:nucleotidyltransferase family protein [Magnetococcales bacterium]
MSDRSPGTDFLTAWRTPEAFLSMTVAQQDLLLRVARQHFLLAAFDARLEQAGCREALPVPLQAMLEGIRVFATERERAIRWEINRIQRAFHGTGLPVILLKGAAYHLRALPMAKGRITRDVDLLLPAADLALAEQCLLAQDWSAALSDPYDQHYYRQWMHEIPPLRHRRRMSELDLHHAIVPRTSRLKTDATRLLQAIEPVAGCVDVWTLCTEDLVLHAVVHLFHDGDFQGLGLRDLLDLDGLFQHFATQEDFWARLLNRAAELNLSRPLDHALHGCARIVRTPIPPEILRAARQASPASRMSRRMLGHLMERVIAPRHPDESHVDPLTALARSALYLRSHWLRMPLGLLIPHLARKWARRWHS